MCVTVPQREQLSAKKNQMKSKVLWLRWNVCVVSRTEEKEKNRVKSNKARVVSKHQQLQYSGVFWLLNRETRMLLFHGEKTQQCGPELQQDWWFSSKCSTKEKETYQKRTKLCSAQAQRPFIWIALDTIIVNLQMIQPWIDVVASSWQSEDFFRPCTQEHRLLAGITLRLELGQLRLPQLTGPGEMMSELLYLQSHKR